jgi:hypothetical protein
VAERGVRDFVPDHVGEFVLVVCQRQETPRDEDVTAGERERVGLELVDHRELVVEGSARHAAEELPTDLAHIGVELRIGE